MCSSDLLGLERASSSAACTFARNHPSYELTSAATEMLLETEVRLFLTRWVHCAFSDCIMGRCYITGRGDVNGNGIVVTLSRATWGSNAGADRILLEAQSRRSLKAQRNLTLSPNCEFDFHAASARSTKIAAGAKRLALLRHAKKRSSMTAIERRLVPRGRGLIFAAH